MFDHEPFQLYDICRRPEEIFFTIRRKMRDFRFSVTSCSVQRYCFGGQDVYRVFCCYIYLLT